MSLQDIRWHQRLENYEKALSRLEEAVLKYRSGTLTDLERQGLIKAFEFTHELAWNVMKDYFTYQGDVTLSGSRDAIREAYHAGLISDGDGWMETIKSRQKTVHSYNEQAANEIAHDVVNQYFDLFTDFRNTMKRIRNAEAGNTESD